MSVKVETSEPMWLQIARRYLGTHEAPGTANNPVILSWAAKLGGWVARYYTADSIPWCGLFAGFCMEEACVRTPADGLLSAGNWAQWGQPLEHAVLGAVLVFSRPGGHHVGFYIGEDYTAYHVLGGNESDSVCIERIAKAHCIAVRWAAEVPPVGQPVQLAVNGTPLSTNQA